MGVVHKMCFFGWGGVRTCLPFGKMIMEQFVPANKGIEWYKQVPSAHLKGEVVELVSQWAGPTEMMFAWSARVWQRRTITSLQT
jgi:hypothetical protein